MPAFYNVPNDIGIDLADLNSSFSASLLKLTEESFRSSLWAFDKMIQFQGNNLIVLG